MPLEKRDKKGRGKENGSGAKKLKNARTKGRQGGIWGLKKNKTNPGLAFGPKTNRLPRADNFRVGPVFVCVGVVVGLVWWLVVVC